MIQRIAERRAEYAAIGEEFFLIGSAFPRDIFLVHPIVAHQTPFVVIACKPNLEYVVKGLVFKDLLFGQMTMIIENGHILCIVEIQRFRRFVCQ